MKRVLSLVGLICALPFGLLGIFPLACGIVGLINKKSSKNKMIIELEDFNKQDNNMQISEIEYKKEAINSKKAINDYDEIPVGGSKQKALFNEEDVPTCMPFEEIQEEVNMKEMFSLCSSSFLSLFVKKRFKKKSTIPLMMLPTILIINAALSISSSLRRVIKTAVWRICYKVCCTC